jgi:hypothetical protein
MVITSKMDIYFRIISFVSRKHPCMNFFYGRFMLEVSQDILEGIKPSKRWNVSFSGLV